jgi:FtsP/CotA-like multicopper oxidase with cupredoxin domain
VGRAERSREHGGADQRLYRDHVADMLGHAIGHVEHLRLGLSGHVREHQRAVPRRKRRACEIPESPAADPHTSGAPRDTCRCLPATVSLSRETGRVRWAPLATGSDDEQKPTVVDGARTSSNPRVCCISARGPMVARSGSEVTTIRLRSSCSSRAPGPARHLWAADGGLLRASVPMTALLIAPGERADVIIDFAGQRNASFIVTNNARAPYPMGGRATLNQLLKIRVNKALKGADATTPAANLRLPELAALPAPTVTRVQHLSETLDPITGAPINLNVEDAPYLDEQTQLPDVTTRPAANAVEDWLLVNTTADTHPIHLHLVTFEVIDRRPFNVAAYDPTTQAITYTGPAAPAAPNENGRKDTVQAHPGQVTRIRARFELPDEGTIQLPPDVGVSNPQYVWHCHILEHEENDMMRAFEVVP